MKNGKFYFLALALSLALPLLGGTAAARQNDKAQAPVAAQAQTQNSDATPALPARKSKTAPANDEDRIAREVRHELVMQPYYTLWDWLAFRVNGNTVELLGDVNSIGLKSDAVNTVKHIEGVEKVIDHINQLPPSPMDDRIRRETAHAIFNFGSLSRYSWSAVPSIHIVVNSGRVRLEGVVDNQQDKDMAGLRANGVTGVFQVTNNLRVVK
ncbi:MAG TPA: BON domain-containing protein [Candidatus Saccharimonadales bacterium]|nr:BON domain-containing protein [Candidatus Saccharimonadales bacterium]